MNNLRRIINIGAKYVKYEVHKVSINKYNVNSSFFTNGSRNGILNNKICILSSQSIRNYAKSRDKKKEKGKSKVVINENELAEIINLESFKSQLQKPLAIMKDDFTKHLSLRTSSGSIELLTVSFEGKDYTLQEIAQVVRKNPSTLVINMAVFPQAIPVVLKAIEKSAYNLNPQQEGTTLYVPIPRVTQEHRENLSKSAKQLFVKCKDSIRDVQVKHAKSLKKKQNLSEDLLRSIEQQIIAMADTYIAQAEIIYNLKNNELLGN